MNKLLNNLIHMYINNGIWFSIVLGTLLHFTYNLSGKNKIVGYFSAINESIWEHIKLSVYPILIYSIYMYINIHNYINNFFLALGMGLLVSVIIVPLLFYTYTKFTKSSIFIIDIIIFILAVVIPFRVIEVIIKMNQYPLVFNLFGLLLVIIIVISFIKFTYNPPNHKIFKEGEI